MRVRIIFAALLLPLLGGVVRAEPRSNEVVDLGTRRELFVDDHLVDTRTGVTQKLHSPVRRDVALAFDRAWEGGGSSSIQILKDGDLYRMYYRGCRDEAHWSQRVQCYAESTDGVHWMRPALGLVEFEGSTENNILFGIQLADTNLAPFKDPNPDVPEAERYKAIAGHTGHHEGSAERRAGAAGLVSADGIRWRLVRPEPLFIAPADDKNFDAHQVAFWDSNLEKYVAYCRGWKPHRVIRRTTSDDFLHWSPFEYLDYGDAPPEHFYTCMVSQYPRAPHLYIGIEKRFLPDRKAIDEHFVMGTSDAVFMSSRDGIHFDRRYLESWIRPGLDPGNWTDRNFQVAWDIVQTSPTELSFYWMENYRHPGCRAQRGTLRPDGFVSMHAGYAGGEFTTKRLRFGGRALLVNYATSAAGSLRVEIQRPGGRPIPGFALEDCQEIYGDHIERVVTWKGGTDLRALAGKPVRFRFVLKDADLYAIRFPAEAPAYAGPAVLGHDPQLDFPGGAMTVEAFVVPAASPQGHRSARILSKYDHAAGAARRGWEWLLLPDGRFAFRVNQAEPGSASAGADTTLTSRGPLPPDAWIHIATVFDRRNRRLRLYLDGTLEAERAIPDLPLRPTPDQDLLLGRYGGGSTNVFHGLLDELRLTASVLEFDRPPPGPYTGREPGTVALYHFDELLEESTVPNAAPRSRLRARLRVPGAHRLRESMPGFGRALKMVNAGE